MVLVVDDDDRAVGELRRGVLEAVGEEDARRGGRLFYAAADLAEGALLDEAAAREEQRREEEDCVVTMLASFLGLTAIWGLTIGGSEEEICWMGPPGCTNLWPR